MGSSSEPATADECPPRSRSSWILQAPAWLSSDAGFQKQHVVRKPKFLEEQSTHSFREGSVPEPLQTSTPKVDMEEPSMAASIVLATNAYIKT